MGNTSSFQPSVIEEDPFWNPPQRSNSPLETERPSRRNDDKLDEFRQELARKHEKRRQIIAEKRKEMEDLRDEVLKQKEENAKLLRQLQETTPPTTALLTKENEELKKKIVELRTELIKSETLSEKNKELRSDITKLQEDLQSVNSEMVAFEKERFEYQTHVTALKDVVRVSKQMLVIRENQLTELREKVAEIEASIAGKEMNVLSEDLRREYERQLRNIRNLRTLYEERQRAERKEKEKLESELEDVKRDLEQAEAKRAELEERITDLETDNSKKYDQITSLESSLGLAKAECRQVQAEMTVINQLLSHILLGANNASNDIDLDKLTKLLEENHDLLQDIVINEDSGSSSALPKVLLDLVNQINDKKDDEPQNETETTENQNTPLQLNSPAEIVKNLPKVWKVLIELLNQQNPPANVLIEPDKDNPCYKLVQTPKGPKLVLSVSQTFIRLKDLIVEKKSLEKETTRLKQLNSHLEVRLQDQEKRLELVCDELSKTWHVVGKMQKQHQLLHTQEKILRYELAQKRKLLTELKEELEYCREKWLQAREKNSTTEAQWKQLRTEFASRKTAIGDDYNNSVESGYSDERESSSMDEEEGPEYDTDVSESNNNNKTLSSSPVSVSEDNLCAEEKPVTEEVIFEGTNAEDVILDVVRDEINEIENEQEMKTDFEPATVSDVETPSTSQMPTPEEVVSAREERLKRLEEETKLLMSKVSKTTLRSWQLDVKLENLHEKYGDNSSAPGVEEAEDSDDSSHG